MRTTPLAGAHRRTPLSCRRHSRTRPLEDRFAALRHHVARCSARCRAGGCGVDRPRSGLRHDETPWWRRRMWRRNRTSRRSTRYGSALFSLSWSAGPCRGRNRCRGRWSRHRFCSFDLQRSFGYLRNFRRRLLQYRCLGFENGLLSRSHLHLRRRGRCNRLGRHDHRRGRTRNRLRRDQARRRLGFNRSCRLRAGNNRRSGLGGHRGRRGNNRSRRLRRNRTRRCRRLSGPLCDRLQHIAGLGDVRQVNLGLELVWRGGRRTHPTAGSGRLIREVLLHSLSFVFFDRAGVRLFLGDADLGQNIKDLSTLDFEFSCQIVDSNLVQHYAPFPPLIPVWLRLHSILTVMVHD